MNPPTPRTLTIKPSSVDDADSAQTWFTADLHFGHANIIKYCDRPFATVEMMTEALIHNWNQVVAKTDTIWILGDFAMGQIAETLPLITELSGTKILIAGNHDRCWAGHGSYGHGWTERYLEAGFDEVVQGTAEVDLNGLGVLASHFPYHGDSHGQDRFVEHRPADEGGWLLHGHVHESWSQRDRMINVGVDANEYRPVSSTEITRIVRSRTESP